MCEDQDFLTDTELLPQIALECETIKIGSYKYITQEKVVISHNGVRFSVPLLKDDTSFITLDVKYEDIAKLLIHFGNAMPVLFFYMSISTGIMIRELLGMRDLKGPYYDPAGKDLHRRIILLPNKFPENSKTILTNLFSRENKIVELTSQKASAILLRTSSRNSVVTAPKKKLSKNLTNVIDDDNVDDDIQVITIYPPPPAREGITISVHHYLCLAKDNFLNDVIIDFYLKYLTLEMLSKSDQCRTHVFSSFFYKRLTNSHFQDAQSIVPMTPAAKQHARVQKWTKNVNIFEKDFIIIPINEYDHWFLAIICFPGLVGKVSACTAKTSENDIAKIRQKTKKIKELKTKVITIDSKRITPMPIVIIDDGSKRNEAEGNDVMEIDEEDERESDQQEENKTIKFEQKEIVKIPCILIFDSLARNSRTEVIVKLREYLSCEHVAKFGVKKIFSKDTIKGACPKVPQQSNLTDCGLYVLQYVESFFKNPIEDYTLPIKTLKTWFEEIVITRKREELSNLLIKLMNNTKRNETIDLPIINFPTQNGKLKIENEIDMKIMKMESKNNKRKSTSNTNLSSTETMSLKAKQIQISKMQT